MLQSSRVALYLLKKNFFFLSFCFSTATPGSTPIQPDQSAAAPKQILADTQAQPIPAVSPTEAQAQAAPEPVDHDCPGSAAPRNLEGWTPSSLTGSEEVLLLESSCLSDRLLIFYSGAAQEEALEQAAHELATAQANGRALAQQAEVAKRQVAVAEHALHELMEQNARLESAKKGNP